MVTNKDRINRRKQIKIHHDLKSFRLKVRPYRNIRNKNRLQDGKSLEERKDDNLFIGYKRIKAPTNLSLIENTNEVLKFINVLAKAYDARRKVFVTLKHITNISDEAIVVLLSHVAQFKKAGIDFNGNKPSDNHLCKKIDKSGFFDILYNKKKLIPSEEKIDLSTDLIFTHAQKNVDAELTDKLIMESSKLIWGEKRRCRGVQRIFIELMHNTNNHAGKKVGDKYWWLNVSKKENPKRIGFSFVDYGMGIIRSLQTKGTDSKFYGCLNKLKSLINIENDSEILNSLLNGEIHKTVTNKSYRGKGLPGICNQFHHNAITRLIVISNKAYVDVGKDEHYVLEHNLRGTFVYFELDNTCRSVSDNGI